MTDVTVDVLCAGLGPAGARAAAAAARRGLRVLAVDRKREPGLPVQCAEFVPALIGSQRRRARALGAAVDPRDGDLRRNRNAGPDRSLSPARCSIAPLSMRALVDEAIEAGATCRFATTLRAVDRDGSVELSDGTRMRARVLIGADGPRSVVGRAIGSVNRHLVETRQITVPLRQPHDATDIFLSAATPGGYAWLFPKGEVANVGAGVDPAHKGALKAIVDDLHLSLVAAGRVGREILMRTGGAIPVGGMLKPTGTLGSTEVLLAGDAAGLANPVTGAGITAAVHSGALAGEAAAEAVGGNPDALADYEDELDALFGAALARALRRREELADAMQSDALPQPAALRRGWVAYPEYWAP